MMNNLYILKDEKIVPCPDIKSWAKWMAHNKGPINCDVIDDFSISTIFLGIDHNFYGGPPILFETMIFGEPLDHEQLRYCTLQEAKTGHIIVAKAVKEVISCKGKPWRRVKKTLLRGAYERQKAFRRYFGKKLHKKRIDCESSRGVRA